MLPQFGFAEFFLLAAVALIVVGPKDLPVMMRKLGQFMARGRAMANEFKDAFDDIARDAELDELRQEIENLKHDNAVTQAMDEMRAVEKEINDSVMKDSRTAPAEPTASPDAEPPKDTPKVDPA
jgi:sec-independent protein translocase protein TatB